MSTASVAAAAAIDSRIAGKTPSVAKPLYSSVDNSTPAYVRNTNCWLADLAQKLTCISVWNSRSGQGRGCTAVHPLVGACAEHFDVIVGDTVRFVTAANVVVTRTVVDHLHISINGVLVDLSFVKFDSPLPSTITPAKVLGPDWLTYFGRRGAGVPVIKSDQEGKALVADLSDIAAEAGFTGVLALQLIFVTQGAPTDATRLSFWEDIVIGDSGQPTLLILNNELVLIEAHPNTDPSLPFDYAAINAQLQTAFGVTLTPIDLTIYDADGFGLATALKTYYLPRVAGAQPYALIYRDADGAIWNGTAFEQYVTANLGNYALFLTGYGNGHFARDCPGRISAGTACTVRIRESLSEFANAPTESDLTLRSYSFTPGGTAVSVAPSGIAPAAFVSGTTLPQVQAVVDPVDTTGGSNIGAGADACTMTITAGGVPVPDADVWITSDSAGATVVAGTLQTDSNGHVTFLLDAGDTYYLWMQKDGKNPILGQSFVAVAD